MEPMGNERIRILELVAQGKLSVQEAEMLLTSLAGQSAGVAAEAGTGAPAEKRPRRMRIQVTDLNTSRSRVNLVLPLGLVKAGLRLGATLKPWTWGSEERERTEDARPPEEVMAHLGDDLLALQALFDEAEAGPLVDVYDEEEGERVLIALE